MTVRARGTLALLEIAKYSRFAGKVAKCMCDIKLQKKRPEAV